VTGWTELGWTELDWTGLSWTGLSWKHPDRLAAVDLGFAVAGGARRGQLVQPDQGHSGQDEHPADDLHRGRQLAEQQPGEHDGEQHLGQAGERGQLGAEAAGGGDAGHVRHHGRDQGQPHHRQHPADRVAEDGHRAGADGQRHHAGPAEQGQGDAADAHRGPGHRDRRQRLGRGLVGACVARGLAGGGREQEVDGQADGGEQAPHHAERVDPDVPGHSQHQGQPGQRGYRAGHRAPPRPLAMPQPQPADHQQHTQVFEQQRHPDRQPLDRAEVEQLAARHRDQAEHGHRDRVPAQQRPPAAQLQHRGDGQQQRGQADPGGHRGGRAPARLDQGRAERARGAERGRGQQGQGQASTWGVAGAATADDGHWGTPCGNP
jgi:hypothetical protein